jgi:hypothetical protein
MYKSPNSKVLKSISLFLVMLLGTLSFFMPTADASAMGMEAFIDDPPGDPRNQDDDEPLDPAYWEAIQRTAGMVWDEKVVRLASNHGLDVLNVTWEDTGRYYDSAVGPNISDVTIQVQHMNPDTGSYELTLMPVIRFPNFTDVTGDIPIDEFYLLVGNERGNGLERISLENYLDNFRRFLSDPDSWAGREKSLLASRDSHVLVSAQAAFLPIPKNGKATFNPVIFNYQSYQGDPAVLTIVATREGTSATIIDNVRDGFPAGFSWGQRLFFNQDGERASFTGERLSDFVDENRSSPVDGPEAAGESGLNMVLLIQVPLKQKRPFEFPVVEYEAAPSEALAMSGADVEAAVVSHGPVEGPFTEIDGVDIERDQRFPIRVTVQFYKATSNGIVTEADMDEIVTQIERVYEDADYVGSLVVDGPSDRPTEYDGPKVQPEGWWEAFWNRFEDNVGLTRWNAREILNQLKMVAWRFWEDLTR